MAEKTDNNSIIENVVSVTNSCSNVSTLKEVSSQNSDHDSNCNDKERLLCVICQTNVARYKCPGCLAATCSCACFKGHKEQTGCNGARDPVPTALGDETPEEMLMRDCRFLEDVLAKVDQSHRNTKFHHIVPRNQGRGVKRLANQQEEINPLPPRMLYRNHTPPAELKSRFQHLIPNYPYRHCAQDGWQPSRFDLSRPLKKLRYEARVRQTMISFLPRGMSRHIENTSHFDEKSRAIRWRVRLILIHANAYVERTVHEDIRPGQVVAQVLDTPTEQLRVWSCTDSHSEYPFNAIGRATHNVNLVSDPFEDGWSEQRCSDKNKGDAELNCSSSTVNCSDTASSVCTKPPASVGKNTHPSSGLSSSNETSKATEILSDRKSVSESIPVSNSFTLGQSLPNSNSKSDQYSPPLLPFQELQSLEPEDLFTSTLNPFTQQPNPYKLCPFKPLVKDLTPDPVADSSRALTPSEEEQFMFYKAAGLGQLAVVFRHEMTSDARRHTLMDLTDTLKENLSGLNVVEYPILLVMRKDHVYEFLDRDAVARDHDIRRVPTKQEDVKVEQIPQSNGLKYFDADCSLDDDQ